MEIKEPPMLIDPYIPEECIVFLYGDTSIGKSPLIWQMAKSIGLGTGFFGLPSKKGNVLFIENDTPLVGMVPRLKLSSPAPGVYWLFMPKLSSPTLTEEEEASLKKARDKIKPKVVFLNTLRNMHDMDDKDSRTPRVVYGYFQRIFPNTALVFVHHTRKMSLDPKVKEVGKESFSGSKHWINDCQVALHLEEYKGKNENLRLYHRKSQITETLRPMPLHLAADGTQLTSPLFEELMAIYDKIHDWEGSKGELDRMVASAWDTSAKTIQRRRLLIEHGLFPGSRNFLMKEEALKRFFKEEEHGEEAE